MILKKYPHSRRRMLSRLLPIYKRTYLDIAPLFTMIHLITSLDRLNFGCDFARNTSPTMKLRIFCKLARYRKRPTTRELSALITRSCTELSSISNFVTLSIGPTDIPPRLRTDDNQKTEKLQSINKHHKWEYNQEKHHIDIWNIGSMMGTVVYPKDSSFTLMFWLVFITYLKCVYLLQQWFVRPIPFVTAGFEVGLPQSQRQRNQFVYTAFS